MNEMRPDATVIQADSPESVPSAGPVARFGPGRLVAWYPRLAARVQSLAGHGASRLRSVRLDRLPQVSRATGIAVLLMVASSALWLSTVVPMSRNVEMLQAEVATLESAAKSGTAIARSPAAQADTFIKGLPTRNDLPSIMTVIITQATDAGLELPSGEYQFTPTRSGQIGRYRIAFPVRGTYPQLREFIDGTLTALPAVALESLRLERESIGETVLEAELQFAVIVRGTT
jgi:Tfp pilus assembly protein PilO